jgi:hypothetical protein
MVENKSTAEFFAKIFNPFGPTIKPEIINPIMPGMFNFLSNNGENRMIESMRAKIKTGLLNGK